jgi:hypothetical protein
MDSPRRKPLRHPESEELRGGVFSSPLVSLDRRTVQHKVEIVWRAIGKGVDLAGLHHNDISRAKCNRRVVYDNRAATPRNQVYFPQLAVIMRLIDTLISKSNGRQGLMSQFPVPSLGRPGIVSASDSHSHNRGAVFRRRRPLGGRRAHRSWSCGASGPTTGSELNHSMP